MFLKRTKENKNMSKKERLIKLVASFIFLIGAFMYIGRMGYNYYIELRDYKKAQEFLNIGKEESKSGFFEEEVSDAVYKIAEMPGICVKGLMAIPPVCTEIDGNSKYFYKMHKLFIDIGAKKIDNSSMDFLSMGMSDDFEQAIECGANIVRIGTALFGRRNYNI